jgi:hypothetical protein
MSCSCGMLSRRYPICCSKNGRSLRYGSQAWRLSRGHSRSCTAPQVATSLAVYGIGSMRELLQQAQGQGGKGQAKQSIR